MVPGQEPAQERRDPDHPLRPRLRLAGALAALLGPADRDGQTIDPALESWLLEHLDHEGRVIGHGYQAVVRRLTSPAGELVVKSPHPKPPLAWFGRRAIAREARVYERLAGIEGIPGSHGLAAGEHLVLEHVEGPTLRQAAQDLSDRERFFARLLATIEAMHAAGIAHGDLKRKENTLVAAGEQPFIIDFGIAVRRRDRPNAWQRKRFALVRQMDLNAWIKLKHGTQTDDLPEGEAKLYRPLLVERWARQLRPSWKRLTFRRWRKARRERRGRG